MRDLRRVLVDLDPVMQRAIAETWQLPEPRAGGREAAEDLARGMLQPTAALALWARLPAKARQALIALAQQGGQMPASQFLRQYGEIRQMGPGRMEREKPWQAPASVAEMLWYHGLITSTFVDTPAGPQARIFTPPDLLGLFPEASLLAHSPPDGASPPADPPGEPAAPPDDPRLASDEVVDDLCTLLAWCQNHNLPFGSGELPEESRQALARYLLDDDGCEQGRGRFAFLLNLAQRLTLVHNPGGRIKPNPAQARPWLQADRASQQWTLANSWRNDPGWIDLQQVPGVRVIGPPADVLSGWRSNALAVRQTVLRYLARIPAGAWWSLPAFIASLKARDPDFARPSGDYAGWYVQDTATGEFLEGFPAWDQIEGRLIRYLITGPLAWLGLVDLGPDVFRAPEKTVNWLKNPATDCKREAPADQAAIEIHLDGSILVPQWAGGYDRFQLARLADWEPVRGDKETRRQGDKRTRGQGDKETGGQGEKGTGGQGNKGTRGRPGRYEYRLTPESLTRAADQGIHMAQALPFLDRVSNHQVPPALRRALERWEQGHSSVRLRQAVVLQTGSQQVLEEIRPLLAQIHTERLSPDSLLLPVEDWPRAALALREAGLLVTVEADDESTP